MQHSRIGSKPRRKQICCEVVVRSMITWDLPGGPVVNNPPSSAGNAGSIPDQGAKILHTSEQFSLSERCNY